MANVQKDLGPVSAYAIAVKHGYNGTEKDWATLQIAAAENAAAAAGSAKAAADTLAAVEDTVAQATGEAVQAVEAQEAESVKAVEEAADAACTTQEEKIAQKGAEMLASIPPEYAALVEQVNKNTADLQVGAPGIACEASGALVPLADAAARPAVRLISRVVAAQGAGNPSPDNVLPITGRDSATLTRMGKNLINIPEITTTRYGVDITAGGNRVVMNGTSTAESAGVAVLHVQPVKAGSYMLSGAVMGTLSAIDGTSTVIVRAGRNSGITADVVEVRLAHNTVSQIKLAVPYDGYVSISVMLAKDGAVYDAYTIDVQLEAGDAATAIEPPIAQASLSADLPEAVCGGSLDWTTGLLTVTHKCLQLDGTENWILPTQGANNPTAYFYLKIGDLGEVVTGSSVCSHYSSEFISSSTQNQGCYVISSDAYGISMLIIRPDLSAYNTVAAWKAYLAEQAAAGAPVQVVYEMTVPYTIQLTPQQLDLLMGHNNLWSDCGGTDVTYIADTKLYIDAKLEELINAMISTGANV